MFKALVRRESQDADDPPSLPCPPPLSNLALQLLESPTKSAELEVETKTPR